MGRGVSTHSLSKKQNEHKRQRLRGPLNTREGVCMRWCGENTRSAPPKRRRGLGWVLAVTATLCLIMFLSSSADTDTLASSRLGCISCRGMCEHVSM